MRIVALAVLLGLGGCGANAPPHESKTFQVEIRGMQFVPATLHVERGDLIVWKNADIVPHTATAAGWFDSGPLQPGDQWSWAPTEAGIQIGYACSMHPTMKASIELK